MFIQIVLGNLSFWTWFVKILKVVSTYEEIEVHHEDREAQIGNLEGMVTEEQEIERKCHDKGKKGETDTAKQLFLFPSTRAFPIYQGYYAMDDH